MSSELQVLRELRPDVAAPTAQARATALQGLLAVIEDEPPQLHAQRAPRAGATPGTDLSNRPRFARPVRWRVGALVPTGVAAVAAAVALSLVLLVGHRATPRSSPPGGTARIEAGKGVLVGEHANAGLPSAIADGLRHEYRATLRAGKTIHTSIDRALERAGERSLRHSMALSHGSGGAFVALDPRTGAVKAIGSASTSPATRLTDWAISNAGASGGTFLPITALAAMRAGVWSPSETYDDHGTFCLPSRNPCYRNADNVAYGVLTLSRALALDVGTFFDRLGAHLNSTASEGGALQHWGRELGFGSRTGIDLPEETGGVLPTPRSVRASPPPFDRWSEEDNINVALGEGDLGMSPIQLAVAYAAIENGGTIVRPHLVDPGTQVGVSPVRRVELSATELTAVRGGLRGSAVGGGRHLGTTQRVFGSFTPAVRGMPGSAQTFSGGREVTNGWYAGYVQGTHTRPLVVVVLVQHAGFGAVTAAPVARQIFSQWTAGHPGPFVPGDSAAQ